MDRTCDPCRVKGIQMQNEPEAQRESGELMGRNDPESAVDCTAFAQDARRIPDWLRPYKDQWLTAYKLGSIMAADGRPFSVWLGEVKSRLRSVSEPASNGKTAVRYLVRHVWAAALAHGIKLVPTDTSQTARELQKEIDLLRMDLIRERTKVRVEYREVDRTADSLDLIRLLVAATEPQPRPGVYFLFGDEGDILYVGQSKNVLARMAGHSDKPYASVRMIHVEDDKRRLEVEGRLIGWLTPSLNLTGLGFRREQIAARL